MTPKAKDPPRDQIKSRSPRVSVVSVDVQLTLTALGVVVAVFLGYWGLYWTKRPTVRLRRLLRFLETKRVLYYPTYAEQPRLAIESVLGIRQRLAQEIEGLNDSHPALAHVNEMHAAALRFLDASQAAGESFGEPFFDVKLTELQETFKTEASALYSISKIEPREPPAPPSWIGEPVEIIYVIEPEDENPEADDETPQRD